MAEVEKTLEIPTRGTGAHRQIATYNNARASGANHDEALRAVVDMLIEETAKGL